MLSFLNRLEVNDHFGFYNPVQFLSFLFFFVFYNLFLVDSLPRVFVITKAVKFVMFFCLTKIFVKQRLNRDLKKKSKKQSTMKCSSIT